MILNALIVLFALPSFAQSNFTICHDIFDKALAADHYGTFEKQSEGVTKQQLADGSYIIQRSGGNKFTFADGIMKETSPMNEINYITTIVNFDSTCKVTSVLGGAHGATSFIFSKADPESCKKRLSGFDGAMSLYSAKEMVEGIWCNQFFPQSQPNTNPRPKAQTQP